MKRYLPSILIAFASISCQSEAPTSSPSLPAGDELIIVHQGYGQGTRCLDDPINIYYDVESSRLIFNFAPIIQSGVIRLTNDESFECTYVFKDESTIDVSIPRDSTFWTIMLEIDEDSVPLIYHLYIPTSVN